jgi:ankyrin repeat protein
MHFLKNVCVLTSCCCLIQVIEYLVEKGANLNERDTAGNSALHISSMLGFAQTVWYLVVKAGATVEAKNNEFLSPLHLAASTGQISTIKVKRYYYLMGSPS